MDRDKAKAKFMRKVEEVFKEVWKWGEEHPEASFDEIAGRLSEERQALMEEMVKEMLSQRGDGRNEEAESPERGKKTQ